MCFGELAKLFTIVNGGDGMFFELGRIQIGIFKFHIIVSTSETNYSKKSNKFTWIVNKTFEDQWYQSISCNLNFKLKFEWFIDGPYAIN